MFQGALSLGPSVSFHFIIASYFSLIVSSQVKAVIEGPEAPTKKGPSEDEPLRDHLSMPGLPAGNLAQGGADLSEGAYGLHTGIFQCSEFLIRCALTTGDDSARMAHALALGGRYAGNV